MKICWDNLEGMCLTKNGYFKKDSCNSRANKDRRWHTAWYKAIMYRRNG